MNQELSNLLVVDDTPANLRLLDEILKSSGYRIRLVTSGRQALIAARRTVPDLLLLDIIMPGMDGFEVCRQFKADPLLRDVPVLFLSAISTPEEKVRAFKEGGIDFITKPFHLAEVESRVRTHLLVHRQKKEIEVAHQRLKELEQLRDNLVHMVAHDMRSPLFLVDLNLHFLSSVIPKGDPSVHKTLLETAQAVREVASLVDQLLDVSRLEAGQMPLNKTQNDMMDVIRQAVASLIVAGEDSRVRIEASEPIFAEFDAVIIRRVLVNLIRNALLHGGSEVKVQIGVQSLGNEIRVSVTDDGPGIPPEFQRSIFDKFNQLGPQANRKGSGLGLAFCRLAVETHGGFMGVQSVPGEGASFWFNLPRPTRMTA